MRAKIENIIRRWKITTTPLERTMDLVLIVLPILLTSATIFTLLIEGFSLTLSIFETFWILLFLYVPTLALRLYLLEEDTQYMTQQKALLYWIICFIIGMSLLSLSLSFTIIKGVQA